MHNKGGSTPEQYGIPEWAEELQDLIEFREMNFAVGNIFKACYRMGKKDGADPLYDINKILYFAQREKNRLMGNEWAQLELPLESATFQNGTERAPDKTNGLFRCMVCERVDTVYKDDWRCLGCGGIVDIV